MCVFGWSNRSIQVPLLLHKILYTIGKGLSWWCVCPATIAPGSAGHPPTDARSSTMAPRRELSRSYMPAPDYQIGPGRHIWGCHTLLPCLSLVQLAHLQDNGGKICRNGQWSAMCMHLPLVASLIIVMLPGSGCQGVPWGLSALS